MLPSQPDDRPYKYSYSTGKPQRDELKKDDIIEFCNKCNFHVAITKQGNRFCGCNIDQARPTPQREINEEAVKKVCYHFFEKYCPVCKEMGTHKKCKSCDNFASELSQEIVTHFTLPKVDVGRVEKVLREMPIRPTRNDKFYFIRDVAQAVVEETYGGKE